MPQNHFTFLPLRQCFPQFSFPCEPADHRVLCFRVQIAWSLAGSSDAFQATAVMKGWWVSFRSSKLCFQSSKSLYERQFEPQFEKRKLRPFHTWKSAFSPESPVPLCLFLWGFSTGSLWSRWIECHLSIWPPYPPMCNMFLIYPA